MNIFDNDFTFKNFAYLLLTIIVDIIVVIIAINFL